MFPSFIGILDIQSWWEVPSIAYFCSLFRTAFNLLDFDIEELEEALLTDGTEDSASSLLTELIVRLLNGCLGNNDISAFNYQMYLRRLFRRKCQETNRYNPFNTDIDFQFLPLRTKVEILYALCDFRLDAEDVFDLFKNLEAESLRVEPLGFDNNDSAYWYFYGTRLYREDIIDKPKNKHKHQKKRSRDFRKHGWLYGEEWLDDEESDRVWQVVCFTEEDWAHLTDKFKSSSTKVEKELYRSLSENFLPEIPKLFLEKERLQRKRTSNRVVQKIKQKEEDIKQNLSDAASQDNDKDNKSDNPREDRAKRRSLLKSQTSSQSDSSDEGRDKDMPQKQAKRKKSHGKKSKNSSTSDKGEPPPEPPVKTGRKTNNSLASATGQILISDNEEPVNSTRKKLKTSLIFSQSEEDIQTDMYKVLEQLTAHDDAWPFLDPVEEEYAPNYYAVIRRPMDLKKMEERLDNGTYTDFGMFKADFKLIVNNCRLYNGQDNEYTLMVDNLQAAFDRLTEKYIRLSSSDDEIAVEFPLPTPSRKHKIKSSESPSGHKSKKRKSHDDSEVPQTSTSEQVEEEKRPKENKDKEKPAKEHESHKHKDGKGKKKKKSHHRKHSRGDKKSEHKKSSKHGKHGKKHSKEGKKSKQKKKKNRHSHEPVVEEPVKPVTPEPPIIPLTRTLSHESLESSNRSRSASPLPSIHTPTPSPTPPPVADSPPPEADSPPPEADSPPPEADTLPDPDFYKDKYDKIKERRRMAARDAWDTLVDHKKSDKQKQGCSATERDKNQKLKDTIEKLKSKNKKIKRTALFNSAYPSTSQSNTDKGKKDLKPMKVSSVKDDTNISSDDNFDPNDQKEKKTKEVNKKGSKKSSAKNASASEALEQAVKDISKLLEEAPKDSALSSPCESPIPLFTAEDLDISRHDEESLQSDKILPGKTRKRPLPRDPKVVKRREIQRTIDRLQPGKSKGNLLTNISTQRVEDSAPNGTTKARDIKNDDSSLKLSLGSVLPTVEFTLGNDHNFDNNQEEERSSKNDELTTDSVNKVIDKENKTVHEQTEKDVSDDKKVENKVTPEDPDSKLKAPPNLSAWFKAFGARKSTIAVPPKKKVDERENEDKSTEHAASENKHSSPKNNNKVDSPTGEISPNPEGGDSPLLATTNTPRNRRTSTGSSISERSSFSQDLDSPRHQMSLTSPLLRSPASPRTEDFQKITYPIINGTIRAGFYQDTTSMKSSPDKSCSPREGPHSPYSPYSQHVYASNNTTGSSTPNYFLDHNKSPLPTYGHIQPPPYYDSSKAPLLNKPTRHHDDYTALGPEHFQHNQFAGNYTSSVPPFAHTPRSPRSEVQHVPKTLIASAPAPMIPESKNVLFPVKKRTYTESNVTPINKKISDERNATNPVNTAEKTFEKSEHSIHPMPSLAPNTVDDIALALSEKSEMAKLNAMREKSAAEYNERQNIEARDKNIYNNQEQAIEMKKDISNILPNTMSKKDNIDMINMGYNNIETEKRNGDVHDIEFMKPNVPQHTRAQFNAPQLSAPQLSATQLNVAQIGATQLSGAPHSAAQHSAVQHSPVQHSSVQHSSVQHSSEQHSTVQHSTVQHSAVQHSAVQHNAAQHNSSQHSAVQHSPAQHTAVQHSAAQPSAAQPSAVQPSAVQHSAVQHSAVQHSAVQHSAVQHSTVQHSSVQHSATQHSATQHSSSQHTAAQQTAAQHSSSHHSVAQHSSSHHSAAQHSSSHHSAAQHSAAQHSSSHHSASQHSAPQHAKGYEVEAIAMNLGMNNQQNLQKQVNKNNMATILSSDKTNIGVCFTPGLNEYDNMPTGAQNVGNFSLNDIELANKKLYSCNSVPSNPVGIDYGNWKLTNQMRKQEILPSDYSTSYSNANEKAKADLSSANTINYSKNVHNVAATIANSINYSKNVQQSASSSPVNYIKSMQQQMYYNTPAAHSSSRPSASRAQDMSSELRIPNPRSHLKNDSISAQMEANLIAKNMENSLKAQKSELIQNQALVNSLQYKTAYPSHSQLQLESLRNLQSIPQMLERYTNDERYLSSLAAGTSSLYHDKSFQMAQMSQMFNKSIASEMHPSSSNSASIYSQPSISMSKETNIHKAPVNLQTSQSEIKSKAKRKRAESKQSQILPSQSYHPPCSDVLSSVKQSMVPGSAFNFGTPPNLGLGSGFYGDNGAFTMEEFRNSTNQLMAANYAAAAVAHRNNAEVNVEKMAKPAHQNSAHSTASFPFMSHSQVRAGYPFGDPSSPLYQQYQEELLRQTGAQIIGLYPHGYPPGLRQPFDSRPSWI